MAPRNDKYRFNNNSVSVTKFLIIAFVIIITIVIIVDATTYYSFEKATETKNWTLHTHRVTRETDEILIALLNIETAQRGYLLTGDTEFLQPLHEGIQDYEKHYAAIVELTADDPRQQERLKTLNDSYKTWYGETIEILIEKRRQIGEEPISDKRAALEN